MAVLIDDIPAFAAQYDVELDFAATMDVTEALNLVSRDGWGWRQSGRCVART